MKAIIFSIILILVSNVSNSQNRKIEFESGNFADLKAKAKKENKLIFIDAYTTWCGPCKWMDKNIFTNDTVADYYNKTFVNAKIDMEKGEGLEIAKNYSVQCYPTYLFIDGDGKLIHRLAGSREAQAFIEVAKAAQDPTKMFSRFENEYEAKKTDPDFLYNYIEAIAGTCLNYDEIQKTYFATQKESDLSNNKNWKLIYYYSNNYQSLEFKYLLEHNKEFEKKHTADSVNAKIKDVFLSSAQSLIYDKNKKREDFEAFKKTILTSNFSEKDKTIFESDLMYFQAKKDWNNYCALAVKEGDKYLKSLAEYNSVAWNIYENSDNTNQLSKAADWMKKELSGELTPDDYMYYDTYAALLFKLKKKEEARTAAKKAISLAEEGGMNKEDYQATVDLLKEIEKLK